jgi:hypothetical protein
MTSRILLGLATLALVTACAEPGETSASWSGIRINGDSARLRLDPDHSFTLEIQRRREDAPRVVEGSWHRSEKGELSLIPKSSVQRSLYGELEMLQEADRFRYQGRHPDMARLVLNCDQPIHCSQLLEAGL